jgi:hypothetical protein
MTICVKYRRDPNKSYPKWVFVWDAWKPLELWDKPWQYYRGNMGISSTFWRGICSCICITSPLLNKLIHWKYRNMRLVVPYTTRDTLEVIEGGKSNETSGDL